MWGPAPTHDVRVIRPTTILQVAQHADDLVRATAFYTEVLGASHLATFDPPGLAFFDVGGVRLLLDRGAPSALIYFDVVDIEADTARLRTAGVDVARDPHLVHRHDGTFAPAGLEEWMVFFHDSEGNQVALVERRPR